MAETRTSPTLSEVAPPAVGTPPPLPAIAWRPVLSAAAAVVGVLSVFSPSYGYHRDELYFRMLPPDVGYTDQPFLTPWLARALTDLVADEVWAVRIAATTAAAVAIVLLALLTRELGGGCRAQTIAAWGYASSASILMFGHVLLPASLDLALWLAILGTATRATLRDPRWWLVAGALIGLATWNRWLVVVLAVGIAVGVLLLGPRRTLRSPWCWAGVALSLVIAAPNLVYQAVHDWPQLAMGEALGDNNAGEVRIMMWPLLLLLLGPPLVPIWLAGIRHLWITPFLRSARFLLATLVVVVAFTFVGGTQAHYFMTPLAAVFAAGCVPLGERLDGYRGVTIAFGTNAVICALIALPLLPVGVVGHTPFPAISPLVADQVGWPAYVQQIATAHERGVSEHGEQVAIITSNYGQAGAVARYGPDLGLPAPLSGHNHLHSLGGPDEGVQTVVLVGMEGLTRQFDECEVVTELDNGVDVDNEEQAVPVRLCHGPKVTWAALWPDVAHLD